MSKDGTGLLESVQNLAMEFVHSVISRHSQSSMSLNTYSVQTCGHFQWHQFQTCESTGDV